MLIRLRRGYMLLQRTEESEIALQRGDVTLYKPDESRAYHHYEAYCVLHEPGPDWRERNLTGFDIIIDRFAGREFRLFDKELVLMPEHGALAYVRKETGPMKKSEVIERLTDAVQAVPGDEITESNFDDLEANVDAEITAIREDLDSEDE